MEASPVRQPYGNEPTEQPEFDCTGQAWPIRLINSAPNPGVEGADWLVRDGSGASARIWWFIVFLIHFRDDPEEVARHDPVATHAITACALSPNAPLPDVHRFYLPRLVQPSGFTHEFTVRSDDQAKSLARAVVQHMCDGVSPDRHMRDYWQRVIRDTAEHLCYGGHPDWN